MHHSTVLHDPVAVATPSQLEQAQRRKERLERLKRAAIHEVVTEVVERVAPVVPPKESEPIEITEDLWSAWIERQKAAFKEPWFQIVDDLSVPREPRRPSIEAIQKSVCLYYDVPRTDLLSARRTDSIVRPRQVSMYLAKILTLKSLPEIGRRSGGKDHTTVLHAVRKIERLRARDVDLNATIEQLSAVITAECGGANNAA